jgi:hypothetical protein
MVRRRNFARRRIAGALVIALFFLTGIPVANRVLYHQVTRGGFFELEVEANPSQSAGKFIALTRHRRPAKNIHEAWDVLFSEHPLGKPLPYSDLRPLSHSAGRLSTTGSASDAAWIAARHLLNRTTEFRWEYVISEITPESTTDELGVQAGDEIRVNEGFIRVDDEGEPLLISRYSTEIRLTRAFSLPRSRPSLKKPPGVTGESAGLPDALVFLDHLSSGDLTAGLTVASTAVITLDGGLIPVGSIAVKTEAAVAAHADVLFIHPENLSVASYVLRNANRPAPELVAVSNLSDAVSWLCDNGATTDELCSSLQR